MNVEPAVGPAHLPWLEDWTFCLSGWTSPEPSSARLLFRTLSKPGDLAPVIFPAPWSFHAGFPESWGNPLVSLMSGGYRLSFPQRPEAGSCTCMVAAPGVLIGHSTVDCFPALFSGEYEIQKTAEAEWLDAQNDYAVLMKADTPAGAHFCLVTGQGDLDASMNVALLHLGKDARILFETEAARRSVFWSDCEAPAAIRPMLTAAVENLIAHICPPCGRFPSLWSAEGAIGGTVLDANQSLALTLAWSRIDCTVAENIVRSVLSCQINDGSIPAQCSADGSMTNATPAWPLIVQSAAQAWRGRKDPAFLTFVLPRLYRYLAFCFPHYDPQANGTHCWQTARESLVPEAFDTGLASADLITLLLCEIEAFLELCDSAPRFVFDRAALLAERQLLIASLDNALWDSPSRTFRSRYTNGKMIERISISAVLPLLWSELPARYEEPLLHQLTSDKFFLSQHGVPLWLKWDDEAEQPPILASHQIFLIEALHRLGARQELDQLAQTVSGSLERHFRSTGYLPENLQPEQGPASPGQEQDYLLAQRVFPSALAVVLSDAAQKQAFAASSASNKIHWLDQHRNAVLGTAVALLVSGILVVTVALMARRTLPRTTAEALAGLARQQVLEQNYDQAISLYKELRRGTGGSPLVELLMGNAYFRKGDIASAEACYRTVLEKDPRSPAAIHNMGLVLFKQERWEESTACYEKLLRESGSRQPRMAKRARIALELIAERSGNSS